MGFKSGTGKCLVIIFSVLFSCGVIASVHAPDWMKLTSINEEDDSTTLYSNYGPFYSMNRTCDEANCTEWESRAISTGDCERIVTYTGQVDGDKLCSHVEIWRTISIVCFLIVILSGLFVLAATCCECFTLGCCGESFHLVAMFLFWIEVSLSIVAWSFVISSMRFIQDAPQVDEASYGWSFWLFIFSGSVLGAICATLADWAAEDSICVKCYSCFKKIFCCCCGGD
uniref:Uncharacterized protein n=1 Tax=Trieres chinensis TaxID=1514140 RepID=A0A7S1YTP6_TRICV|mmetsp:Transcript_10265/g.21602  ORF Transcript_10265/g.21602 Transcript_10265/m.21602 type:complete len:227 (+) Transcript_10265:208-888(+)